MILGLAVFTVGTFVELLRVPEGHKFQSGTKAIWVVVILLTGVFGAALYLLAGKPLSLKRQPGHLIFRDPDDAVYWCNKCSFATNDRDEARGHASMAASPSRPASGGSQQNPPVRKDDPAPLTGFELPRKTQQVVEPPRGPTSTITIRSASAPEYKACPDCAEDVRFAARKCRFCGFLFEGKTASA